MPSNMPPNIFTDLYTPPDVPCRFANTAFHSLVFIFPFFILRNLTLRRRQKIGLVGIFSLGVLTMVISLSRFIAYSSDNYNLDDASGGKNPTFLRAQDSNC